jgi:hypothetical protein
LQFVFSDRSHRTSLQQYASTQVVASRSSH